MTKRQEFEDDGMTVADMSDVRPQPLLIPDLGYVLGRKGGKTGNNPETPANQGPIQMDRSERRAFIGGTIAAYFVAFAIFALVFVIAILLLIKFGH